MSNGIFLILFIIIFCLIIVSPIFLIAFVASQSRKIRRKKIIKTLPQDIAFYSAVRINSAKKNAVFFKFKAFECSGILYVYQDKIYFKSTKNNFESIVFDLSKAKILWVGIQVQNGALQWFTISDDDKSYYFNVDTGTTIFKLSKSGDTTKGLYEKLLNSQTVYTIGNIGS